MWLPKLALLSLALTLLQAPTSALRRSYVVYLGAHGHDIHISSADDDHRRVVSSHLEFLASHLGSFSKAAEAIFYSYTHHINGFAAMLEAEEAAQIAKDPRTVSVFLNKPRQLHTTHSWEFMMLEIDGKVYNGSIWNQARYGEDTIIANIDSGVWPESKSFSDQGYGPIPPKWRGICQDDDTNHGVKCNKKLIGARYYNKGHLSQGHELDPAQNSARDFDGHGTHTLSTAGGNFVQGASISGAGNGTTKGGAPRARVATYKICWSMHCYDADILKAIDDAIHDGVDVISMSLGSDEANEYFNDAISIGSFHAVSNGVLVVCSAGNSGPVRQSVVNVSPWIFTVGASTTDREFQSYVELRNGQRFKGSSLSEPLPGDRMLPLVTGIQARLEKAHNYYDALTCETGALDPEKVKGKILVCVTGYSSRIKQGHEAALAGAIGMILCNDFVRGNETVPEPHVLPAAHINFNDGVDVMKYIYLTDEPPLGFITTPSIVFGIKPAPQIAFFSSVGPNPVTPEILKPDITAPGVNIMAAFTEARTGSDYDFDERKLPFNLLSGTSMACPHVSGVAALLRTLHPDWSPSAIKSAIMTTARIRDNVPGSMQDSSSGKATPFLYGSGHIRPNAAQDPGLVYDLSPKDYLNFLCVLGYGDDMVSLFSRDSSYKCPSPSSNDLLDFNYPSITVPELSGTVNVTRKLKNVGSPGTYRARVRNPLGVVASVEPSVLEFKESGEEKNFELTLRAKSSKGLSVDYVFGGLVWSDGFHHVRSPIVVAGTVEYSITT